jgi:hypothetical protein
MNETERLFELHRPTKIEAIAVASNLAAARHKACGGPTGVSVRTKPSGLACRAGEVKELAKPFADIKHRRADPSAHALLLVARFTASKFTVGHHVDRKT